MSHPIKDELARAAYDHLTRHQEAERAKENDLRAMIKAGTMTQDIWNSLTPGTRERVRDNSELHPLLMGLEGWRVEAVMADASTVSGFKPRRFIVGKTTGWRPCHLAMRKGARGSSDTITPRDTIKSVRKLEQER